MKIELSKRELKLLRAALMYAVMYEEEFVECHINPYTKKPIRGSAAVVRKAKSNIKAFHDLRVKVRIQETKIKVTDARKTDDP